MQVRLTYGAAAGLDRQRVRLAARALVVWRRWSQQLIEPHVTRAAACVQVFRSNSLNAVGSSICGLWADRSKTISWDLVRVASVCATVRRARPAAWRPGKRSSGQPPTTTTFGTDNSARLSDGRQGSPDRAPRRGGLDRRAPPPIDCLIDRVPRGSLWHVRQKRPG